MVKKKKKKLLANKISSLKWTQGIAIHMYFPICHILNGDK